MLKMQKACETVQAALNKAGPASVASAVAEQSVQIMKSGGVSANTAIQHLSISWDLVGQYITFLDFENCELGRVDDVLVLIDTMTQMANLQKLNLAGVRASVVCGAGYLMVPPFCIALLGVC